MTSAAPAESSGGWVEVVPRHVRVVSEWPMAATKIQKFRLREQLCRELGIRLDG